jgi:hypothetical protein
MSIAARLRPHLSYANVMATIAVFLALGGVGYAATALPKNSVGAPQIKRGGVASSEVKNGSLKRVDFSKSALASLTGAKGDSGAKGAKGDAGPKGDTGARGATGATGDTGPAGLAGVEIRSVTEVVASGSTGADTVVCPIGSIVLGGGATVAGGSAGTSYIQRSGPSLVTFDSNGAPNSYGYPVDGQPANGWEFQAVNQSGSPRNVIGYAICAKKTG